MEDKSEGELNPETQALFTEAFKSIHKDLYENLKENQELLKDKLSSIIEDLESTKSYLKHVEDKADNANKNLQEKDELIGNLTQRVEELEMLRFQNEDAIENLKERLTKTEGSDTSESPEFSDVQSEENAGGGNLCKEYTVGVQSMDAKTSEGKQITLNEAVEGKNVLIGNDLAVVAEGDAPEFVKPPQNNLSSLANKDAEMPGFVPSATQSAIVPGVGGTCVGNDQVNIQNNLQQIYIPGIGDVNKEDEYLGEKNSYRKADREEFTEIVSSMSRACNIAEETSESEEWRKISSIDTIHRLAGLFEEERKQEHFINLIHLLADLDPSQRVTLSSDLELITSIDISERGIDFQHLAAFFSCFKFKRFDSLSMKKMCIRANDIRVLSSALGSCTIGCLNLEGCSFEYMAFLELASLLAATESVVLDNLTSSEVITETGSDASKEFSRDEAKRLAESISMCRRALALDLSHCDYRNLGITKALSTCLCTVTSLTLRYCNMTEDSVEILFGSMQNMRKLDLSCSTLRNAGVAAVARFLGQIRVLLLSNVLLDEEGVGPLIDALVEVPEKGMGLLDLSFNPINKANFSALLNMVGRVKVILFSPDQITDSNEITETEVSLKKVSSGCMDGQDEHFFTHWAACVMPVEREAKKLVKEVANICKEEIERRTKSELICKKCKTHIAFVTDVLNPPPWHFLCTDKTFSFPLSASEFKTVDHAVACIVPTSSRPWMHNCRGIDCPIARFKTHRCDCSSCGHFAGTYFSSRSGERFWCLHQESIIDLVHKVQDRTEAKMRPPVPNEPCNVM